MVRVMFFMDDVEILAIKRLIHAAEKIADGSFSPESPYKNDHYTDVYDLVETIK